MDSDIMRQIKEKAEQDRIALNTLVSHALKRYIEWDMHVENRAGIVPLCKPVALELFNRLNREGVINLALDVGKKAVYDTALFMKGIVDRNSFIE